MSARVFTLFNHGTGSHRSRTDGEIVAEFGSHASGTEYRDFLITDGPGAVAGDGSTDSPMAGSFDPYTRDKQKKSAGTLRDAGFDVGAGVRAGVSDPAFMDMTDPSRARGLVTGQGWDDNVIHAIATISELSPPPEAVNMIGWSRGAVTCTKLAHKLGEVYPQMGVNIFAIDPVAGLGNRSDEDASTIGPNVRNYVATLAMHEQRAGFEPQDLARVTVSPETNAIFLPFPGKHNTEVRLSSNEGEAAQVVWSLAYLFLKKFGTGFNQIMAPRYPDNELCNLYGRMRVKMADYHGLRQRWFNVGAAVQGGIAQRQFMASIEKYVVDAHYFINGHHREAFQRAYPRVFGFLFEGRPGNEQAVYQEFRSMYNLTGLMESLKIFGVEKPAPGHPFVLPPPGAGKRGGPTTQPSLRADLVSMGLF